METVTGYVTGINGNLANVSFDGAVHKNEVAYILVDGSTRCQMVSKSEIR